jgi:hypothetical protein
MFGPCPVVASVHAQRVFRKLGLGDDPGTNRRVRAAVTYLTVSANG